MGVAIISRDYLWVISSYTYFWWRGTPPRQDHFEPTPVGYSDAVRVLSAEAKYKKSWFMVDTFVFKLGRNCYVTVWVFSTTHCILMLHPATLRKRRIHASSCCRHETSTVHSTTASLPLLSLHQQRLLFNNNATTTQTKIIRRVGPPRCSNVWDPPLLWVSVFKCLCVVIPLLAI